MVIHNIMKCLSKKVLRWSLFRLCYGSNQVNVNGRCSNEISAGNNTTTQHVVTKISQNTFKNEDMSDPYMKATF